MKTDFINRGRTGWVWDVCCDSGKFVGDGAEVGVRGSGFNANSVGYGYGYCVGRTVVSSCGVLALKELGGGKRRLGRSQASLMLLGDAYTSFFCHLCTEEALETRFLHRLRALEQLLNRVGQRSQSKLPAPRSRHAATRRCHKQGTDRIRCLRRESVPKLLASRSRSR